MSTRETLACWPPVMVGVPGFKAELLPGVGVLAVVYTGSSEQDKPLFHNSVPESCSRPPLLWYKEMGEFQ